VISRPHLQHEDTPDRRAVPGAQRRPWASLRTGRAFRVGGSGMPTQMVVLGSESRLAGTTVGQSLRQGGQSLWAPPGSAAD
jgi:hypothetical protein